MRRRPAANLTVADAELVRLARQAPSNPFAKTDLIAAVVTAVVRDGRPASVVAATIDVAPSTVYLWLQQRGFGRDGQPLADEIDLNESQKRLHALLVRHLEASLEADIAIKEVMTDPEYLRTQDARSLAEFSTVAVGQAHALAVRLADARAGESSEPVPALADVEAGYLLDAGRDPRGDEAFASDVPAAYVAEGSAERPTP